MFQDEGAENTKALQYIQVYEPAAPPAGRGSYKHLLPGKEPMGAKNQRHFRFHVGDEITTRMSEEVFLLLDRF